MRGPSPISGQNPSDQAYKAMEKLGCQIRQALDFDLRLQVWLGG